VARSRTKARQTITARPPLPAAVVRFLVCRPSQKEMLKRRIHTVCRFNLNIEKGPTYELGNRLLGDNLTLGDNLATSPNSSVLLGRISLIWAGDDRMRRRGLLLHEHYRRAVCRPVTLRVQTGPG
jgi:hypothetical protein